MLVKGRFAAIVAPPREPAPEPRPCECGATLDPFPLWGRWNFAERCAICLAVGELLETWRRQPRHRPMFGLPTGYETSTLDSYECPPGSAKARDAVASWKPDTGFGLFLHGKPGGGKTHLAFALARSLSTTSRPTDTVRLPISVEREDYPAVYARLREMYPEGLPCDGPSVEATTVPGLLSKMRKRFQEGRGAEDIIDRLVLCDVLVLDDLGAESGTDWAREQLFTILNERLSEVRPCIVTSNLSLGELARHYTKPGGYPAGERLASRIAGGCDQVLVQAAGDYRLTRRGRR